MIIETTKVSWPEEYKVTANISSNTRGRGSLISHVPMQISLCRLNREKEKGEWTECEIERATVSE